jgi:hypothetical protein
LDVSALDTDLCHTIQNYAFEALALALARCAPDVLANLLRRKLAGFASRPAKQRYASAVHATEQLLLVNEECAAAARVLRLSHWEQDEINEAFAATQLLILEIHGLAATDQITAIMDADLKYIFENHTDFLKPLSNEEVDALVRRYAAGTLKQISDLVLLLSGSATGLNEEAWQWLASLAMDEGFKHRGVAFKLLNASDPKRFGRVLSDAGWSWQPDGDMWCNHYV